MSQSRCRGKIRTLQYLSLQNPGANFQFLCKRPENGFEPPFETLLTQKSCPKNDLRL